MSKQKTHPTEVRVEDFLDGIEDAERRADCYTVMNLMQRVTGSPPKMWGPSMVGFGQYHYKYASGREGYYFLTGFSPRKRDLTLYIMAGLERYGELLDRLGKYKTGKSCLYLKRLADVDLDVLGELIRNSVEYMVEHYETLPPGEA